MNSLSVGKKLGLMGIIILLLLFILGVITYLKEPLADYKKQPVI